MGTGSTRQNFNGKGGSENCCSGGLMGDADDVDPGNGRRVIVSIRSVTACNGLRIVFVAAAGK